MNFDNIELKPLPEVLVCEYGARMKPFLKRNGSHKT